MSYLPETKAPTLVGTFSHAPADTLSRISKTTGISVSSLSTLTVSSSSKLLYDAVIEYAALFTPQTKLSHFPLMVDGLDYRRNLFEDDDDLDGISASSARTLRFLRNMPPGLFHRQWRRLAIVGGKGPRRRRVPIPKFRLSTGEAQVLWPPPPHLTAENLIAERHAMQKKRIQERNNARKNPTSVESVDKPPKSPQITSPSTNSSQLTTDDNGSVQSPIFVAHYSVGEPYPTCDTGMETYREVLLISTEGMNALREFATGVIKWRVDKDYRSGDGKSFALHRFKTRRVGGVWEFEGMKRARQPCSVILQKGQMEAILEDVRKFISPETKKWFRRYGLPHRRCLMFAGDPGTGKTSTIRAIASTFRLNCCYLNVTNAQFSNQLLGDALSKLPENALIVLEDVDALFNEDRRNKEGNSLTFSGLLNALDGVQSAEGVLTVMTTNHIERLDPALIRGGRVDRRFYFSRPSQDEVERLFLSFYPSAEADLVKKFAEQVFSRPEGDEARAMSTLQQLFIEHRESTAEECVAAVTDFYTSYFPEGTVSRRQSLYT